MLQQPHHVLRTLWALDLDGIAGKLESFGRLCADLVAGASAVMAMLPNADTLERHPLLKRLFLRIRHIIATVALDSEGAIAGLLGRGYPRVDLKANADLSREDHRRLAFLALRTFVWFIAAAILASM